MRLKLNLCGVSGLLSVLVLTGCGVERKIVNALDVDSPEIMGRSFGGQQPVVGATISVVAMGSSGYGSAGRILASVTTDGGGNFRFAPGAYTCPQPDTPVYLMGVRGNPGVGAQNPSLVLAAGLGTCAGAPNTFTVMNEVTTAGLAFTLAHFFSTTLGGTNAANDWFGGPSTGTAPNIQYSKGLVMGNNVTIPTIVFNAIGAPNQTVTNVSGTTYTVEWQKINTLANILVSCVNSTGSTSTTETTTPCGRLFSLTQNTANPRPSDTLQAAVQMALHPLSNVTALYNLIGSTPQFSPYLSQAPNDWTIGVSYTTPALGLGVNTGTLSTLDIDTNGRVWFPSNAAGKIGAAYFDPISISFNGPFNSTALVHPQQVAIDSAGYAWYNDSATATVGGYLTTTPATTQSLSLPNWTSSSVTISADDRIYVGVTNTNGSTFQLGRIPAGAPPRTGYSLVTAIGGGSIVFTHPSASLAGDSLDGAGIATADPGGTELEDWRLFLGLFAAPVLSATNANSGQVVYTTGINYISALSAPTTGGPTDGLCDYQNAACNTINVNGATTRHGPQGMAVDGNNILWVSESANGGVLQIPVSAATANPVIATELLHGATGATGGGTVTAIRPYGIGIDATGNVWMTNAGCNTTGCTPGGFTLTEIVGAATPTIAPASAQITSGTDLVGTEPRD